MDGIDANQAVPPFCIEGKTTPGPIFWVRGQLSFQRIHVHVVEFFDPLLQTPNVKVIEAALPEANGEAVILVFKTKSQLRIGNTTPSARRISGGLQVEPAPVARRAASELGSRWMDRRVAAR